MKKVTEELKKNKKTSALERNVDGKQECCDGE